MVQWFFPFMVAIVSWGLYLYKFSSEIILLSFNLSINREADYEMTMIWDSFTLLFLITVGFVAFFVMVYTYNYFDNGQKIEKFLLIMIIFIISMMMLVMSGDLLWVMVGWDGLGLSSFCLIAFYQNWKSLNSAVITFMINRFGDFFLISSLGMMVIMVGSSKMWLWSSYIMSWMICVGAFTKSAQIPFSTWLPLAMAAPTPVSSLVHSSTLVTAGVFLLIRFNKMIDSDYFPLIYFSGLMTILLAGISSLGENDLKKVIALSTLSHVGMMIMFVGVGSAVSAQVHLLVHAMFKSVLFMVSGMIIHNGENYQDIRNLYLIYPNFFLSSSFIMSLLSMMGAPFMAGFLSKEICMDMLFTNLFNKLGIWMMFLLSVSFTCSYSIRMIIHLFSQQPSNSLSTCLGGEENQSSMFFMMSLFSSIISGVMIKTIFEEELYSFSYFSIASKYLLVLFISLGLLGGLMVAKFSSFFPISVVKYISSMGLIESTVKVFQTKFFNSSFIFMYKFDIKGIEDLSFSKVWKSLLFLSKKFMNWYIPQPLDYVIFTSILSVSIFLLFY